MVGVTASVDLSSFWTSLHSSRKPAAVFANLLNAALFGDNALGVVCDRCNGLILRIPSDRLVDCSPLLFVDGNKDQVGDLGDGEVALRGGLSNPSSSSALEGSVPCSGLWLNKGGTYF